jgi:hypothetical protein
MKVIVDMVATILKKVLILEDQLALHHKLHGP